MAQRKKILVSVGVLVTLIVGLVVREHFSLDDYVQTLRDRGVTFHTINSPTNYFLDSEGMAVGMEADLARDFARYYDIPIRFQLHRTIADVLHAVENDPHSVGAAGLTVTPQRETQFLFGPQYLSVRQQLVCPKRKEDLEIRVSAGTSYIETLKKNFDPQNWEVVTGLSTEQLLEQVHRKRSFCTIADSTIVDMNRRYLPNLQIVENLGDTQPIAWAMSPQDHTLRKLTRRWFINLTKSNRLNNYLFRYYSFTQEAFDEFDIRVFHSRTKSRLPHYKKTFIAQSKKMPFDWTLLAAMAYQESHWNPKARSPTGVRGLMMLTRTTASSVGVQNRLDPIESIRGGSAYLLRMYNRFGPEVKGKDRLWMSLAAYNVGWGHLSDARILCERLGKNPNRWQDVREVLPFLADPDYYHDLPHGYARGQEPVNYVKRIRNYRDILQKIS